VPSPALRQPASAAAAARAVCRLPPQVAGSAAQANSAHAAAAFSAPASPCRRAGVGGHRRHRPPGRPGGGGAYGVRGARQISSYATPSVSTRQTKTERTTRSNVRRRDHTSSANRVHIAHSGVRQAAQRLPWQQNPRPPRPRQQRQRPVMRAQRNRSGRSVATEEDRRRPMLPNSKQEIQARVYR